MLVDSLLGLFGGSGLRASRLSVRASTGLLRVFEGYLLGLAWLRLLGSCFLVFAFDSGLWFNSLSGKTFPPLSENQTLTKGRKMTASKNGKVTSSKDSAHNGFVTELSSIPAGSLSAELVAFERGVSLMAQGLISVRGLKASILKAEEVGALPTIRSSWAEHFPAVATVRAMKGGKDATLRASFAVVVQGKKALKGEGFAKLVESAKTFQELADAIPAPAKKAPAPHSKEKAPKVATVEDLLKALGNALKTKPVLSGKSLKDAEAVAHLLANTLKVSRTLSVVEAPAA